MQKIFESEFNGFDESATKLHVYALESEEEFEELDNMMENRNELCDYFNVTEEPEFSVAPGALYHSYNFELSGAHMIMYETIALNV